MFTGIIIIAVGFLILRLWYKDSSLKHYDNPLTPEREDAIIFNQYPPPGVDTELGWKIKVAGTSYAKAFPIFCLGENQQIELCQCEVKTKKGLEKAIEVIGIWYEGTERRRERIGYLPRNLLKIISKLPDNLPLAATIHEIYPATSRKSPGIRIDVWRPRKNSKLYNRALE